MLDRSAFLGPAAQRKIAPFHPVSRLGKALARLPERWIVFRQGGFSPTDGVAGTVYGGVYIALHPEKGVALVDLAPAQPEGAIPGLRAALRAGNFAPDTLDDIPVRALVLNQNEIATIADRLDEIFAGTAIKDDAWIGLAVTALTTRFPLLMEVAGTENGSSSPASADGSPPRGTQSAAEAAPAAPRSARPRADSTPSRASATVVPIPSRASPLRTASVSEPAAPSPPKAHTGTKAIIAAAIVLVSIAAAAAILLPLQQSGSPTAERIIATQPAPLATPSKIATTPALPSVKSNTPATAATAPPAPTSQLATAPANPPAAHEPSVSAASPDRLFAKPVQMPTKTAEHKTAESKAVEHKAAEHRAAEHRATQTAATHGRASHATPQTAAAHPAPKAIGAKKTAMAPPAQVLRPRAKEAKPAVKAAAAPSAVKRTPRKVEAAARVNPPAATVTVDGVTYVKGREPRSLGTVLIPPGSGDATAAAGDSTTPGTSIAPGANAPAGAVAPIAASGEASGAESTTAPKALATAKATAPPAESAAMPRQAAATGAPRPLIPVPASPLPRAHAQGNAVGAPIQLGPPPFDQP